MVLDVKAMTWAAQNGIDTAKLKAAKVPIYGKWYFPEIPANLPLVNLETGERRTFAERMIAGEVMWVAVQDLRRAELAGFENEPEEPAAPAALAEEPAPVATLEPEEEPLLALVRLPAGAPESEQPTPLPASSVFVPLPQSALAEHGDPSQIHLPLPSMAPLILGVGISIALLGVITNVVVLLVGLLWSFVGAIGWIRIGVIEARNAPHNGGH